MNTDISMVETILISLCIIGKVKNVTIIDVIPDIANFKLMVSGVCFLLDLFSIQDLSLSAQEIGFFHTLN